MTSNHHFELYLMHDQITAAQWHKLSQAIAKQGGLLGSFEFIFMCADNVVRFFVTSTHDVSALSSSIDGVVLI